MVSINTVNMQVNRMKRPINEVCKIKRYLKIEEKLEFYKEYISLCEKHKNDFDGKMIKYICFIFFDLLIVKYYTNIDIPLTYDGYDELMENNIFDKISEYIGDEYSMLPKIFNMC